VSDTNSLSQRGARYAEGTASQILVLGIGNLLMQDEGVGIHAVRQLKSKYDLSEKVELIDGGTSVLDLLPELEDAGHLIVIDALRCDRAPGTVVVLRNEEVPAFFRTKLSPHQVGLADVLAMLSFKGTAPASITLLGVVPSEMSVGMELSPVVSHSMDQLLATVAHELARSGARCEMLPGSMAVRP
jgi:hydrogenase maturation protease